MKLFEFNDPFFIPLWRRIAVVAVAVGWGIFEFVHGATFWGALFAGLGAIAFYGLFIKFDPPEPAEDDAPDGDK